MVQLGFEQLLSGLNVLALLLGTMGGILLGAAPELPPTFGLVLVLPLCLHLPPVTALLVWISLYCAAQFGGSISAILAKVPGNPAASVTLLDGHRLACQGRAMEALTVACLASALGGLVSSLGLYLLAPYVAKIPLHFAAADFLWLLLFAIVALSVLSSRNVFRGLLSALLGLLLALFLPSGLGVGTVEFTVSQVGAGEGMRLVLYLFLLSFFVVAPAFSMVEGRLQRHRVENPFQGRRFPPPGQWASLALSALYASLIGWWVGLLPGTGAGIGSQLAYRLEKARSRQALHFGHGAPEGVAAAEAGNNASIGGALLPTLGLGIPGDEGMVVLLAGLSLLGLLPGPSLFGKNIDKTYAFFAGFVLAHVALAVIGLWGLRIFVTLLRHSITPLVPLSLLLSVGLIGQQRGRFMDALYLLPLGLLAYFMRKFDLNVTAFSAAFLLAPRAELALEAVLLQQGAQSRFLFIFSTPMSRIFLLFIFLLLLLPRLFQSFYRSLSSGLGRPHGFSD